MKDEQLEQLGQHYKERIRIHIKIRILGNWSMCRTHKLGDGPKKLVIWQHVLKMLTIMARSIFHDGSFKDVSRLVSVTGIFKSLFAYIMSVCLCPLHTLSVHISHYMPACKVL